MAFEVEVHNVDGRVTALGSAGGHTLVVDRPRDGGGGGLGFNGGELLHLAVAGCISNDLFREAAVRGIELSRVAVRVEGDFTGDPARSSGITYDVELSGRADAAVLRELVAHVDSIAEIPATLRAGTSVGLRDATVTAVDQGGPAQHATCRHGGS